MTTVPAPVSLVSLKAVTARERDHLLQRISALELSTGQEVFVGAPAAMVHNALADPERFPFAIVVHGAVADTSISVAGKPVHQSRGAGASRAASERVVGMGVLHAGAATEAGWADQGSAILLRGFLVDWRHQGLGYGTRATAAAVELARNIVTELKLPATGVVLGVHERNSAGRAAYLKSGFVDRGQYVGGRSGPQRILFRPFDAEAGPIHRWVNKG